MANGQHWLAIDTVYKSSIERQTLFTSTQFDFLPLGHCAVLSKRMPPECMRCENYNLMLVLGG
jgi:hypothetical protein